ncbi:MAG: hypothetical protein E6J89_12355 [Deltaproteobacteria bacterium]|nr:MAG: hypothetical protein E6J89_12355 [Deltaproteobacteria bacterium]
MQAVKKTTNTIPIVMGNVADPVAAGLVASLARDNHVYFEPNHFGCEVRNPIELSLGIAELNADILSLNIAKFPQTLLESLDTG